jgi:hypothetical protein
MVTCRMTFGVGRRRTSATSARRTWPPLGVSMSSSPGRHGHRNLFLPRPDQKRHGWLLHRLRRTLTFTGKAARACLGAHGGAGGWRAFVAASWATCLSCSITRSCQWWWVLHSLSVAAASAVQDRHRFGSLGPAAPGCGAVPGRGSQKKHARPPRTLSWSSPSVDRPQPLDGVESLLRLNGCTR